MRDAIDCHLADRSLDGETIARATALSRSTLYRLLEPFGGIARCIMRRRLALLHTLLAAPKSVEALSELAERVGLASASHASHAFLRRFGLRPGAFRTATNTADPAPYAAICLRLWEAEFAALIRA